MTLNEYQVEALRTASGMNYAHHGMIENAALGLCGEAAEVESEVLALIENDGTSVSRLEKELGDVAWYIAIGAHAIGFKLEMIFTECKCTLPLKGKRDDRLLNYYATSLTITAGEIADAVKKAVFQGHELDVLRIATHLRTAMAFVSICAYMIGSNLAHVLQMNVDKLRARYPDGFEAERSLHRKEGDI